MNSSSTLMSRQTMAKLLLGCFVLFCFFRTMDSGQCPILSLRLCSARWRLAGPDQQIVLIMERGTKIVSQPGLKHRWVKKSGTLPWIFIQEWDPKIKGLPKQKFEGGMGGYIRGQIEMGVEQRCTS